MFGKVVEGMETVDAIAAVPTTRKGMYENVPVEETVPVIACETAASSPMTRARVRRKCIGSTTASADSM